MQFKDYYDVMGVDKNATPEDIKRAHRKLARKFHPDVSKEKDADARFKELGEAYDVLKDPEKRRAYDQLGADWKEGQEFRPPPEWNAGAEHAGKGAPWQFNQGDAGDHSCGSGTMTASSDVMRMSLVLPPFSTCSVNPSVANCCHRYSTFVWCRCQQAASPSSATSRSASRNP